MSDAVLTVYFQPGENQKSINSIISSFDTLLVQVSVRLKHLNMSHLSYTVLTVYFQPGTTINQNGINSIFSSLFTHDIQFEYESAIKIFQTWATLFWIYIFNQARQKIEIASILYFLRWIHSLYKYEYESTIKISKSKWNKFNILFIVYTRYTIWVQIDH